MRDEGRLARIAFRCVLAAMLLAVAQVSVAAAVSPPREGEMAAMEAAGTLDAAVERARATGNDQAHPQLLQRLDGALNGEDALPGAGGGLSASALLPPWPEMYGTPLRSSGIARIPAVIIDFPDYPAETSVPALQSMLFGTGDPAKRPMESLRSYYQRSSYGKLDIQGDVLGIYRAPFARSTVSTATYAAEHQLVTDALQYFDARGTDFTKYDADGDGKIDYVIVFFSGPSGSWASFWWGRFRGQTSAPVLDGKVVNSWSWQWEPGSNGNAGTVIHETGHALGLPDYYDYDDSVGPYGGVGPWDVMGSGGGDHGAFSKMMLGWMEPTAVTSGSRAVTLRASGSSPDAVIVMPRFSLQPPLREFFIAQVRNISGNDARWPYTSEPRLQIWHVNPSLSNIWSGGFLFNNSYTSRKLLRLMEADGREDIEAVHIAVGEPFGGDLFVPGQSFGPSTTPSSTPYWGVSSGVSIGAISRGVGEMSFTASVGPYDLDMDPPITTCQAPTAWQRANFGVTFAAVDPSEVALTQYRIPSYLGAGVYRYYGNPRYISTSGVHTVEFMSVDVVGNVEATKTAVVRIDGSRPSVTATTLPSYEGVATIPISAADAHSGVAEIGWRIDSGQWTQSAVARCSSVGTRVMDYYALDQVGNRTSKTATFTVVASKAALSSTVSTSTAYWGDTLGVSGRLTVRATGATLANRTNITVWSSPDNGASWSSSGNAVWDAASMSYKGSSRITTGTLVQLRFAGESPTYAPCDSTETLVACLKAPTSLSSQVTTSQPYWGETVRMTGRLTEIRSGAVIPGRTNVTLLTSADGTAWSQAGLASWDATSSTYGASVKVTTGVKLKLRYGGEDSRLECDSPVITVRGAAPPAPVHRFYNAKSGVHFYTASDAEKAAVIAKYSSVFTYEGVAYGLNASHPGSRVALHRFYNARNGVHFYTASEAEKASVIAKYSSVFTYEGVAYYVSARSSDAAPVHRFYNAKRGVHFYTASEAEKAAVIAKYSSVYAYEGVGFYLAP